MNRTTAQHTEGPIHRYLGLHAEAEDLLEQLNTLAEDHFNVDPDNLTWANVGDLEYVVENLRRALGR